MMIITLHLLVTIIKFLVGTKTLLKKSEYSRINPLYIINHTVISSRISSLYVKSLELRRVSLHTGHMCQDFEK